MPVNLCKLNQVYSWGRGAGRESNVSTKANLPFHSVTIKLGSKHEMRNVNLCSSCWFSGVSECVSVLLQVL